ncbi:hypothetical protein NL676_039283 [Syzygium grande]|nr:hypothetical protein NL676_039283 [Syzygium grande]
MLLAKHGRQRPGTMGSGGEATTHKGGEEDVLWLAGQGNKGLSLLAMVAALVDKAEGGRVASVELKKK